MVTIDGIGCSNSIPPTTTIDNFDAKINAARGNVFVDVAFWGGVIPGNQVSWRISLYLVKV